MPYNPFSVPNRVHELPHIDSCVTTECTVCPTRYRTRHFFNNSNTNEDIATKFEQDYVRCVRNEEECVCSAPNCCDTKIIEEMPGSVANGTHYTIMRYNMRCRFFFSFCIVPLSN